MVNDRWSEVSATSVLLRLKPARLLLDLAIEMAARQDPDFTSKVQPPPVPHSDYTTPEYTQYADIQTKKWEMTRGIGSSFGYNRAEQDADYAAADTLITSLVATRGSTSIGRSTARSGRRFAWSQRGERLRAAIAGTSAGRPRLRAGTSATQARPRAVSPEP